MGQTKHRVQDRFVKHFYHIKYDKKDFPIGKHYNFPGHDKLDSVEITILDFIHCRPDSRAAASLRDQIEKNWIHRLRTAAPYGINTMDVKKY